MKLTELHTIKFPSLHTHLEIFTETVLAATYPPAGLMAVPGNLSPFKPTPGETQGDYLINQPRQPSVNLFTLLSSALALCSSLTLTTAFAADFINITPPAPGGGTYVQTVYVNGSTVYAPTDNGLAISTDGGYTYTNRTAANGLGGGTIAGIYVSGSTVYAATGGGLSISTDGGNTFTTRTNANSGLAGDWLFDVYVDGTTIYTAGNGWLSISTDGGTSFNNRSNANSGLGIVGSTIYGVYARGSDVYAATNGGGVSISHDGGTTFTSRTVANSGLGNDVVGEVYLDGTTLYAATNGGGLSISTDGGNTFNNRTNANSGLSADTVNGVYAIGSKVCVATNGGGLAISTDGGTSFVNKYSVDGIGDGIVKDCYFSELATYAATNNGVSFTPPLIPPTGLTATVVSQTQIDLSWSDNSSNETGFKLEQLAGTVINTTAVNVISYSHTGLTCGTTYNYTVKATNAYYGDSTRVTASGTTQACPLSQTITFTLPASANIGDAPLTLTATGGASGNPVTFASTTPSVCTVSGTTLTLVNTGTCTVTADQAGNANYLAATQVSQNLTINSLVTTSPLPDINIRQDSTNIPTSGSFEVGPSGIGHHVHHTFTIDNLGNSDLILSGTPKIRVSGANASEFSVDDTATTSPIAAGTSTTFILTFIPATVGNKTATLTITNNDGDEGNYTVTITGSAEPHKNLQVTVTGSGQGTVTSKPEGVDCEVNGVCLMPVIDAPQWVYLTAVPATGSIFTGWSGDPACQVDGKVFVMADTACVATFELKSYELSVGRLGQGQVTGPGLDCPPECTETFLYGTEIQLEAVADREWIHTGWKGSCDQTGKVKLTNALLCQAIFQEDPAVPNQLDGNGDGIPDAHQPNVISLSDKVNGNYVTFAVQPDTCVISDVYTDLPDNYGKPEKNKPMPQGLIYFELACRQAQISLYYHAVSTVKRNVIFRKFGPLVPGDEQTAGWYLLPNVTFEAVMIGGKSVVKASYTLKDGELGDSTGVDGRIVDPGGIVVK